MKAQTKTKMSMKQCRGSIVGAGLSYWPMVGLAKEFSSSWLEHQVILLFDTQLSGHCLASWHTQQRPISYSPIEWIYSIILSENSVQWLPFIHFSHRITSSNYMSLGLLLLALIHMQNRRCNPNILLGFINSCLLLVLLFLLNRVFICLYILSNVRLQRAQCV